MAWRRSGVRIPSGPPFLFFSFRVGMRRDERENEFDIKSGWYHGIALRLSSRGMKGFLLPFVFRKLCIRHSVRIRDSYIEGEKGARKVMITRTKYYPGEGEPRCQKRWEDERHYHAA